MKKIHNIIQDTLIPHAGNNGHPHIVRHGTLAIITILAIATLVGVFSVTDPKNTTQLSANVYSSVVTDLTNEKNSQSPVLTSEISTVTASEPVASQTPWYQKLLIQLSRPLGIILLTIGILLGISFLLSVVYHKKVSQHIILVAIVAFAVIFSGYIYLSIAKDFSAIVQNFI